MIVKVFTMQKDEDDILIDWIEYHAYLFGYDNIYIIDNNSGHKSKSILNLYQLKGCHIYNEHEYLKKGDHICDLINKNPCDFAIPLDLDEFIGTETDNSVVSVNRNDILNELYRLININHERYSFAYYLTSINNKLYYKHPLIEITKFNKIDNINSNKKFFKGNNNVLIGLDHGNHTGTVKNYLSNEFVKSKLILFHFHYRGVHKLIQKCKNDITGLGYSLHVGELQRLLKLRVLGSHNIETYLKYYQYGTYSLIDNSNGINVESLSDFLKNAYLMNESKN